MGREKGRQLRAGEEASDEGDERASRVSQAYADLIYDVGGHLGEDSDFYLKLGFRVVAVEANPLLAKNLRTRFAEEIAAGRYVLVEKAVAEAEGETDFFVNERSSDWGTAVVDWAQRKERVGAPSKLIRVPSATFAQILREHGIPHYLKVDIEGADMLCVRALSQFDVRPDYVSIESGEESWRRLVDQFETLERLGYRRFQVVEQGRHDAGTFETLDGLRLTYGFGGNSTGPFGSYLPAKWLTRKQALRRYRWIFLRTQLVSEDRFPGTFLRKIPVLRRLCRLAGWYDTHAAR